MGGLSMRLGLVWLELRSVLIRVPKSLRLFIALPQAGDEQNNYADDDAAIGDIEDRPIEIDLRDLEVNEVGHHANAAAVDEVAHSTAQLHAERDAGEPIFRWKPRGVIQNEQCDDATHHKENRPTLLQDAKGRAGVIRVGKT